MQTLEDEYERTLQDEAKELEQLLSKRNILLAKQEEYSKKIRELGPLSSDAFEMYYSCDCSFFSLSIYLITKKTEISSSSLKIWVKLKTPSQQNKSMHGDQQKKGKK